MNIKKKNISRIGLTIIIYIICYLIETTILKGSNVYITEPICPILGLVFGPYGAIGVALGNLLTYSLHNPNIYAIPFTLIQFLIAYIPYKLWYILNKEESYPPKLNTVKKFINFIITIILTTIAYTPLINLFEQYRQTSPVLLTSTLQWALGFFDLSIIFALITLIIIDLFDIEMYKPKILKFKINKKIFYIFYLISVILGIINFFYTKEFNMSLLKPYLGIIILILLLLFITTPITGDIGEHVKKFNKIKFNRKESRFQSESLSLIEKLLIYFQILSVLIAILLAYATYVGYISLFYEGNVYFSIMTTMFASITLFYIPGILLLKFVEKRIIKPIGVISNTAKNYIDSEQNTIGDRKFVYKEFCQYVNDTSEVGDLAFSYYEMITDLDKYVENLKKLTIEKEHIETELNVAKHIQESFIPKNFQEINNEQIQIYGLMKAAKEVGGDFYDFYYIDDDHLVFLIGDVSGKGIPGALFMAVTKTIIKNSFYENNKSLDEIYYKVNNQICQNNEEDMFITSWIGILELSTGKINYVNAGHNPPVVRKNNKYGYLESEVYLVLGGLEESEYESDEIILEDGDQILLYTDGVTEANDIHGSFFGEENLIKSLENSSDLPIEKQVKYIKQSIDTFTFGTDAQFDDITLLLLRYYEKKI